MCSNQEEVEMDRLVEVTTGRPRESGASPRDRLLTLRADVEQLVPALSDAGSWPQDERRSALRAVDALVAAASAARAHLLLAERDAESWRATGAASFARWRGAAAGAGGARAGSAGSGAGAAAREERQAEALVRLPAVGAAVRAGVLGLDHASVIGAVAADRSDLVRAAVASPSGQAELVELARSQDVPSFARAVRRWAAARDDDALENAHEAQRRARFLHLGTTDQGTRISGRLDAVAGHRLRLALEAVTPRPAADDDRTSEQRAADALVTLAENALTEPATAPGASVRPHVSLLVREETWRRHRRHAPRPRSGLEADPEPGSVAEPEPPAEAVAGAAEAATDAPEPIVDTAEPTTDVPEPVGGVPEPATWEDGTPLPGSEVGRVLCDCDLTRVVLDADDVPLNLGRTRRTYTGSQRRAVIARDRGCRWPGCAAQARWCEIHHIRWWGRDEGETSVVNGVLLCSFHHHEVHRRDLTVSRVGVPVRGVRAGSPGRRAGGRRALTGAPAPAGRSGSAPADVEPRDPGGGARYRFVSGDGRVVAGPGWTPATEDVTTERATTRHAMTEHATTRQAMAGDATTGHATTRDVMAGDAIARHAMAGDSMAGGATTVRARVEGATLGSPSTVRTPTAFARTEAASVAPLALAHPATPPIGSAPTVSAPGRTDRTWHASRGRPSARYRQDALDGVPP
jgi:hypothetical protein